MPQFNIVPRGLIAGVVDRIARAAQATSHRLQTKGTRSFPAAPWFATDFVSGATWMPRDTTAFAREGFMQNAIVYRCVRMIAEAAGSIPFCLYDGANEIEDHPLLTLLKEPTPTSTRAEFMESLIGHLLVSGNAYVEAIAARSDIRELHILRPDRVTLVPGEDGWPEAYDYTVAGTSPVRLDGDVVPGIRRVLHQKLFHPLDDHYGLSPIEAAATAIDIHNSAARWNKALLDNSARPSGALVYTSRDGNLTTEQYQRLKAELEAGFQGAGNAGRPLLLEGGLDWKTMSMSPKDLDFIEAKHAAAREIALALGVPPMLLGIPGDNTFSNYQEANRTFWRSTMLPLVQRLVSSLGTWLTPGYEASLRLDIDLDNLDALAPERDALWARLDKATFLTNDEKRKAAGYGSRGHTPSKRGVKFDPDQPRDTQGRWTLVADGQSYDIDLLAEDQRGGHTYPFHVNKSDEFLLGRVRGENVRIGPVEIGLFRAGSFPSLEAANKLTSATLSQNSDLVEMVARGEIGGAELDGAFGSKTGREAYKDSPRSQPYMRDTYAVKAFIRSDRRSPNGFTVITSYPFNP